MAVFLGQMARGGSERLVDEAAVQEARVALLGSIAAVPIYQIAIELETVAPVELSEYPGSALRGALVQALLDSHCTNKAALSCAECPLVRACPVSTLVAPLRDEAPRGRDVPRPFVITPPHPVPQRLAAGERWQFGLTLFGSAAALFPYVVLSRGRLEANGIGARNEAGRRGRIAVRRIASIGGQAPVTLYEPGSQRIAAPVRSGGADAIIARAATILPDRVTLEFLTPMRLKAEGDLQRRMQPAVLIHRILERWEAIRREYLPAGSVDPLGALRGTTEPGVEGDPRALLAVADGVRVTHDATQWVDVASYSSRQRRFTPIGGLLGQVKLEGSLGPLREVLALGEVIHAGKDVVKGNGHYRILSA